MVLQKLDVEYNESKKTVDEKEVECQKLRDELETIRQNYEEQLRVMSEHLTMLNSKIENQSSHSAASPSNSTSPNHQSTTSSSNSLKENLRKMVRK